MKYKTLSTTFVAFPKINSFIMNFIKGFNRDQLVMMDFEANVGKATTEKKCFA